MEALATPRNSGWRHIFRGLDGLRAGWAALLFLVLFLLLEIGVNLLLKVVLTALHLPLRPDGPAPPLLIFVSESISTTMVLLATWIMARVEHRPFGGFGLGDRTWLPRLLGGLAVGFVAISVLIGILWAAHLLVLHGPVLAASQALRYGVSWAAAFLLVGFFEELLLRGYLLQTLARGIGFFWSALLLSALFGFSHVNNHGESPVGLFSAAAVGFVFCLSIWYTRSLWWAIGAHAAWDWGQSFFWGTLDSGMVVKGHLLDEHPVGQRVLSGGATGPEGSVFVFTVLLLMAASIYLWWGRTRAPRTLAEPTA